MTQWIDICSMDDLQPNSGVCALVNSEQVAIFYFPNEDKIYAIGNYDPIGKANVLSRGMVGDINGEPVVACSAWSKTIKCLVILYGYTMTEFNWQNKLKEVHYDV